MAQRTPTPEELAKLFPQTQADPYADLNIDAIDEPPPPMPTVGAPTKPALLTPLQADAEAEAYNNQGGRSASDWFKYRREYEKKRGQGVALKPLADPSKPNLHALSGDAAMRNVGIESGSPAMVPTQEVPQPMRLPAADGMRINGPALPKTKEQAVAEYVAKAKGIELPEGFGRNIARLIADVGSNIRGKIGTENDPYFDELQKRADAAPEIAQKREFTKAANDPASDVSAMGREMATQMLGKPVPESMSWAKVQQILGPASKLMDERLESQFKFASLAQHEKAAKAAAGPKTPDQLKAEEKGRYDNLQMIGRSLAGMRNALGKGDWTFTLAGDNDFTKAARDAAEAYGRMQSGGAINKDEEKNFLAKLPTPKDSPEMQQKKLDDLETMIDDRIKTIGVPLPESITSAIKASRQKPTDTVANPFTEDDVTKALSKVDSFKQKNQGAKVSINRAAGIMRVTYPDGKTKDIPVKEF